MNGSSWRLSRVKPEADEDKDSETEQPEGPTEVDLASEVGVMKTLIKKALKKLEADGLGRS